MWGRVFFLLAGKLHISATGYKHFFMITLFIPTPFLGIAVTFFYYVVFQDRWEPLKKVKDFLEIISMSS